MRIGAITEEIQVVENLGIKGVGLTIAGVQSVNKVRSTLSKNSSRALDGGLKIAQIGAWKNLVHPDSKIREKQIELIEEIIRASAHIQGNPPVATGAGCRSGSSFSVHRENLSTETKDVLLESLNRIAEVAEENEVNLALEPGIGTPLADPERIRKILETIDCKYITLQMDPFNLLDVNAITNSGDFFRHLFDVTKGLSISAHLKDVYLEPKWPVQFKETGAGEGWADYDVLLQLLDEELGSKDWALIEHTPQEEIPKAYSFITKKAESLGIKLK